MPKIKKLTKNKKKAKKKKKVKLFLRKQPKQTTINQKIINKTKLKLRKY